MPPEEIIYFVERVPDLFSDDIYYISFQKGKSKIPRACQFMGVDLVRAHILRDYKNNRHSPEGIRPLRIHLEEALSESEHFKGLHDWVMEEVYNTERRKKR